MEQLYELNLRDYWHIFLKRRWIFVLSFLSVFLSIFIYINLQIPIYRASVLIKIDPYLGMPSELLFPSNQMYWMPEQNLSDYTKQLISRPILEAVAKDVGLIKDGMSDNEKNSLISNIASNVSAAEIEKSNMIRLDTYSRNAQRATDIANKIAETFKKVNAEQKNQRAYNVRAFIDRTLDDVSKKLKEQEERLRYFTTQGVAGIAVNTINQVYALEQKRAELLTKYTERHPDVIRLDEQIAELKNQLKELPKEEFEYGILKRDITINENLYTYLKQKLPEAQIKEAEKVDNVLIVNPAITPRYPFSPDKKKSYVTGIVLGLLLGVTMSLITEHIDTSIGRVEDIETFIKSSVLGVIPYCAEKSKEEVKEKKKWLKIFFGKKVEKKVLYGSNVSLLEQSRSSLFLEAFRIIGVNLQVLFGKGERIKNKIILITSCNPEEGKTLITSNLAVILAQMGYRVLIIDADTRRSSIHKIFGLKHKEGGLLDILTDKMTPDAVIRTATDLMLGTTNADKIIDRPWLNNLNLITAGTVFPNTINLFNSRNMDNTLNCFKNKYDVVLVDTSPILAVSEPSIILPKVDGVLLVYKAGSTSRLALRRAKTQIESVKGKGGLSGIILNNVTPEIGMDTYYYYGKKYYYGEKEKEKPSKVKKEEGEADV